MVAVLRLPIIRLMLLGLVGYIAGLLARDLVSPSINDLAAGLAGATLFIIILGRRIGAVA